MTTSRPVPSWLAPVLTGGGLFTLFMATLTSDNSYDAVAFSIFVERAAGRGEIFLELFHPHHVQHLPLAVLLLIGLQALGVLIGGLVILQVMAAVAGGVLGGLLVHRLRPHCGTGLAVATSLACLLATGTWFYGVDGENNLIGLAFAAAAIGPAAALLRAGADAPWRRAGALLGIGAALHILVGALWIALLGLGALRGIAGLRRVVPALLLASGILAVAYAPRVACLQRERPGWRPSEILLFAEHLEDDNYFMVNPYDPVAEIGGMVSGVAPTGRLAAVARLVPLAWLLAAIVAGARRRLGELGSLAAAWFAVMVGVLSAWSATDFEFTAFMLVPLAIAGGCGLGAILAEGWPRRLAVIVGCVLAGVVGVAAWTGSIRAGLDPSRNDVRVRADLIASLTGPDDVVLVSAAGGARSKVYVPYFAKRRAVIPEMNFGAEIDTAESLRRLRGRIADACAHGGTLFALGELVDPWPGGRLPFDHEAVRQMLLALGPEPAAIDTATGRVTLYRFRECPR